MTRLTPIKAEDLDAEQKLVYEAIQSGPRGKNRQVGLVGPFGIWVRSPRIGMAIQNVGAVARFETALTEDVKEVAICTVGAHFRAKFEFAAHRALALQAGVAEDIVDAIERRAQPEFSDDRQRTAWAVAHQLLDDKRIDDETFATAMAQFGESALIELVSIIGYYCLVSVTLNTFQVPVTGTMTDPWPDLP